MLCSAQPSVYQRYFAANMHAFSSDYDQLIGPVKADLFSQLFAAGEISDVVEVQTTAEHAFPQPLLIVSARRVAARRAARYGYWRQLCILGVAPTCLSQASLSAVCYDLAVIRGTLVQARDSRLRSVTAVDPNPAMLPYAQDALAAAYGARAPQVTFVSGRAEALPVETGSVSAVVSTLVRSVTALASPALPAGAGAEGPRNVPQVLCSVADLGAALSEVRRVLRPGGAFLFIEHTAAGPGRPLLRVAQQLLNPLQRALADNCNLTRDIDAELLQAHSLSLTYQRRFDVPGLGLIAPHVAGLAVRSAA